MKASDKTIVRKTKNSVGERTQPCFTRFPASNHSKSSILKLTDTFILICKTDTSLTKWSGHPSFHRMFHSTSLFRVKSFFEVNMKRDIFCPMHFSCTCHKKILSVVPWFVWNPHCTSGRKSSTRIDSPLSSIQTNTF